MSENQPEKYKQVVDTASRGLNYDSGYEDSRQKFIFDVLSR